MTAIDTTAMKATGVPALLGKYAGIVMMAPSTAMKITAAAGTRREVARLQILHPGMAPSREYAQHMPDALVRHAAPQNACPTVEMTSTSLNHDALRAVCRTA